MLADTIVYQEWRVPEYSYDLKVEMVIAGKKSTDQKRYDEMVKRLTPRDRTAFETSKAKCSDDAFNEKVFSQLPGVAKAQARYEPRLQEIARKITQAKDEDERTRLFSQQSLLSNEFFKETYNTEVKNQITNRFEKCLADAGMSPEGRKMVANSLLATVFRSLTRRD